MIGVDSEDYFLIISYLMTCSYNAAIEASSDNQVLTVEEDKEESNEVLSSKTTIEISPSWKITAAFIVES